MIDAFECVSAWRILPAVLPYYCYARQDRKDKPRVRYLQSQWRIKFGTARSASRVLTLHFHAPQFRDIFDVRRNMDHLFVFPRCWWNIQAQGSAD